MPSSYEHRIKVGRNRAFLTAIDATVQPEWAAIVAFYTALHLIDVLAARDAVHPGNHREREDYLARHRIHSVLVDPFAELERASHVARYHPKSRFDALYPPAQVTATLIGTYLADIETYVATPPPTPTN